jgi:hypothetical protein
VGIRRLGHSVEHLVSRREFRTALATAATVSELATFPVSLRPIQALAGGLEKGKGFSPPTLEVPTCLENDVSLMALQEYDPRARPPKGAIFSLQYHRAGKGSHAWLNKGEESKLKHSARRELLSVSKSAKKARLSRTHLQANLR